jgi:hypothetical protein
MPRKRKELIAAQRSLVRRPVKMETRFCFSRDGIFADDGQYRWWKEWDDSGYGWSGQFDIISKDQLRERVTCAQSLGVSVYEKHDCTDSPEGFDYERVVLEDLK